MTRRILQLGALAVVLAATTHAGFDLDRFLVPKELVLHATALLAALFSLRALRQATVTKLDLLLVAFLVLSGVAAIFATNPWLAIRALAITASGLVLFWCARVTDARSLLNGLALAVVLASITSLLQTYGINLIVFADNRAPGGTLGNRNFVAHAAAFGFPLVLLAALRAQRAYLVACTGVMLVVASLVLTRSRAAWLAFAAMACVFVFAMLFARALRRDPQTWRRLLGVLAFLGAGVAAALLIPNTLRWRSDNPYLDSVRDVANYQEGSGRGRLIQYERSLRMAASSPLFGVGPGNWPVEYPDHAARRDPSLDPNEPGMTYNPWPSSDWVAFVSERGFAAFLVMAAIFVLIALGGLRRAIAAVEAEEALLATTLVATIVAAGVAGAFDAVLLLPLPALLVWTALGALWRPAESRFAHRPLVVLLVAALCALGTFRSGSQLVAMSADDARVAARVDPGNYRAHLRLARRGKRAERCAHARAAFALYPHAEASRSAMRGCE